MFLVLSLWQFGISCDYSRLLCHFAEVKSQAGKYYGALGTHSTDVFAKLKCFLIQTTRNLQLLVERMPIHFCTSQRVCRSSQPATPTPIWLDFVKASFNRIKMSHLKDRLFHGAAHMVFTRDFKC